MPWSSSCGTVSPKSTSSVTGSYQSTFSTAGVSSLCCCRLFPKSQWPSLDLRLTEFHFFRGGMAGVLSKCNKSGAISPEGMGNPSTKRLGWYLLVCETKSKYTGRVWSSLSTLAAVTDLALNQECACRDFRENHCSCFWPILRASRLKSLKKPPAMWETRFDPWLGRSPGGGHGNPLQYSCLENPHGQRSLAGCSPWGCKELDTTEQRSTAQERHMVAFSLIKLLLMERNQNLLRSGKWNKRRGWPF